MSEEGFFKTPIAIIGGAGRMGRWLAPRLSRLHGPVDIFDHALAPYRPRDLAGYKTVVLALPVGGFAPLLAEVGPHLDGDALVWDLASLKEEQMELMLAHCPGPVAGSHPMFGPGVDDPTGHTVFICPGRGEGASHALAGFWASLGCAVRHTSPPRHDRLMATAQNLRHLVLAALAQVVWQDDLRDDLLHGAGGSWFEQLLGMMENQAAQPAGLYTDLALHNPHSREALAQLMSQLQGMSLALERRDQPGLEAFLDKTRFFKGAGAKSLD